MMKKCFFFGCGCTLQGDVYILVAREQH